MQKTFLGLMFSFAIFCHFGPQVSVYFWKRRFCSIRTERIRIVFACPHEQWKYDGISYTGHVLHDLWNHRIRKPPFSKTPLWRPISKTCVFGAWKRRLLANANLRFQIFQNIRMPVDRTFFFLNHRAVNSPDLILISANAILYHVTRFPLHLPFTVHYFFT